MTVEIAAAVYGLAVAVGILAFLGAAWCAVAAVLDRRYAGEILTGMARYLVVVVVAWIIARLAEGAP